MRISDWSSDVCSSDLRLQDAFARPDTIVVHDSAWTATARSADIVLPATMSLERDDIGAAGTDPRLVAMKQVAPPAGEARDDFAIFSGLAARRGAGRSEERRVGKEWVSTVKCRGVPPH